MTQPAMRHLAASVDAVVQVQYLSTGNTVTLGTGKTQQLYMDGTTGHVLLQVTSTFAQTGTSATHERVVSNNIGGGPEQPSRKTG